MMNLETTSYFLELVIRNKLLGKNEPTESAVLGSCIESQLNG
jgi:hypothetical protein